MKKKIKIFIISPSDVAKERQIAKDVCFKLNKLASKKVNITPVLWEDYPMDYRKNAQENIDDKIDESDIFVVILWKRLGSVVDGYEGMITGDTHVTGTQYEIEKILASKKKNIYFYFKTKEKSFVENELEEALYQKKILDKFLDRLAIKKGTKYGYHEFKEEKDFREKLIMHLSHKIGDLTGITFDRDRLMSSQDIDTIDTVHPNYFVGLYMFLTVLGVISFLTTQIYDLFPKIWKPYIVWFSVALFGIMSIAIQSIPTETKIYKTHSFTIILYTLLRRGGFMLFSAILLSIFIVLFVLPQLQTLFVELFSIIRK